MAAGFHPRGGCISVSDEGIKCSRTLWEERRTVQISCVAHAVLAQFMDAFNVDFLVDPYPAEMVQDLFSSISYAVVWNPCASGQGTSLAWEAIPGRSRKKMPCCLYSVLYQVARSKTNATQCLYKTELSSQTKIITVAITFVETCHNTNLLLASESQRIILLQQRCLVGTDMWPVLLKRGKKWLIPAP